MKPIPFDEERYAQWHEAAIEDDRPFLPKLASYRERMMVEARPDLSLVQDILTSMFTYSKNEYRLTSGREASYSTSLSDCLRHDAPPDKYELLFKSISSIVNKLWRKGGDDGPAVTLDDLPRSITDLIRTDVRTETLESAEFLARRMNDLPNLLYDAELKGQFESRIESVAFEPEMKMASGYFAYHGLFRFRSGYAIEVQIYSALMSEWRKISHLLYEKARLEPTAPHQFGTRESRLISLGHMLHLAECEIQRLAQEFK